MQSLVETGLLDHGAEDNWTAADGAVGAMSPGGGQVAVGRPSGGVMGVAGLGKPIAGYSELAFATPAHMAIHSRGCHVLDGV